MPGSPTRRARSGTPAPPPVGTRPPFAPGNAMAVTHGARSPRVYGELAELLAAGLLAERPDLADHPEAVAAWATVEAQAALLRRHVGQVGPLDDDGEPRERLLANLARMERLAADLRRPLGLDPLSAASLARERATASTLAVNLQAIADAGRAAVAQRTDAPPDLAGRVLEQHVTADREQLAERTRAWNAPGGLGHRPRPALPATNPGTADTTHPGTTDIEDPQ